MTDPVGGLRARLLHDSFVQHIRDGLTELGWFDSGRSHLPVTMYGRPRNWDEAVEPNAITVSTRSRVPDYIETGSDLIADRVEIVTEVYAQGDSFGVDITHDIRDLLRGRLVNEYGTFPLYDFRHATPPKIGYGVIEDVQVVRPPARSDAPYTQHWFSVVAHVIDYYYDEGAP